ncbi:unnamed protein product [Kuraishia capsulata CBS 1993]|uniref:DNA repair protein REV1 n=1 Tax=Kuraishia capsulata CBS 1993 TaxID=1382522 RepID=W6MK14_9ASCO|nr:uncharacterized protein KUCA_T00000879001 [Kuraishia capsulata CBS 1993]CDK24912.1 unnamed protein product [Kuraishia capsulata CBS 1993]
MDDKPIVARSSSDAFWSSLGDSELVDFVNALSQRKREDNDEEQKGQEKDEEKNDAEDEIDLTLPDEVWNNSFTENKNMGGVGDDILGSLTLAQKPNVSPEEVSQEVARKVSQEASQQAPDDPEDLNHEEPEFGDMSHYFKNKRFMQQKADEDYVEWLSKRNGGKNPNLAIFEGCIIYVNGRTDPDIEQLHKMIIVHGGTFLAFLGSKGSATHIIASNLTPRKRIEFRNYKVVKPEWIVESIRENRRLPWSDYQLIDNDYGQAKIGFARENERTDVALNAKHPGFLEQFFSRSRLHHLSTWKADLRAEHLQRALEESKTRPKRVYSKRAILHIDFDCFFAAASSLKQLPNAEDFRSKPICVTHGGAHADVASCNYVARKMGAKNGMWLEKAQQMCSGQLICLEYDFDEYERISKLFYDCLLATKPHSLLPVSVDEALLDVSNIAEEHDLEEFMSDLRQKIWLATHCTVSAGCAPNVLLAKLALRNSKPDGQLSILNYSEDEILKFLNPVDIRDLPGVGYSVQKKLMDEFNASKFTLANLRNVDRQKLVDMLGVKTGATLAEYSRGLDSTSIDIASNPDEFTRKSISIDVNWGIRFDTIVEVETFLVECAKVLSERLLKAKMFGSQLTMKLAKRSENAPIAPPKHMGMGMCDFVSKSARLGISSREPGILSSEAKSLYRILGVPPAELRGIALQVTRLVSEGDNRENQNQMRLPFQKAKEPQFPGLSSDLNPNPIPAKRQLEPRNAPKKVTPADIKKRIKDFMSKPRPRTTAIEEPDLNVDQINWDVFNELPKEIQIELQTEFERRGLVAKSTPFSTPKKRKVQSRKTPSPSKDGGQQQLPESLGGTPRKAVLESPLKKCGSPSKSPFKAASSTPNRGKSISPEKLRLNDTTIDMAILQELPSSIRNDIVNQAEAEKEMKTTEMTPMQLKEELVELPRQKMQSYFRALNIPSLQNQWQFSKVKSLLQAWISAGIGDFDSSLSGSYGPLQEDSVVVSAYLSELLWEHNDITRVISLVEHMEICILDKKNRPGYDEWKELVSTLDQMLKEYLISNGSKVKYIF